MFTSHWDLMLLGIVAVLIARAIGIFIILPWVAKLPYVDPISRPYQTIIFWGGLRGAEVVALALSIPLALEYWYAVAVPLLWCYLIYTFCASTYDKGANEVGWGEVV